MNLKQKNIITTRRLSNTILLCGLLIVYLLPTDFLFNNPESYCLHKNLFHFDCPGCGMTRALHSLLHGHFKQAMNYNFGVIPLAFFFILNFCHNIINERYFKDLIKYVLLMLFTTLFIQYISKSISTFL